MKFEVDIPKHTIIQYVRDRKNTPHGVIVALKAEDGSFRVGYSLCNKKDRFNKQMALKIAMGRADLSSCHTWRLYPESLAFVMPHPVKKMIPAFLDRCKKYYKVQS